MLLCVEMYGHVGERCMYVKRGILVCIEYGCVEICGRVETEVLREDFLDEVKEKVIIRKHVLPYFFPLRKSLPLR